ncbi:MAG: hypothetical protein QE265_03445 [Rhodoferax sp.]|nr:hypothetical protein [Rhodoferax sp.]
MTSALSIAAEVLPHFRANVMSNWTYTYGHYAAAIGRSAAKEGVVIGKAMHVIGAACVMAKVPVAPIHYVERADGEWQGIFERAASESIHVRPHWPTLAVSSRVHRYTDEDFNLVSRLLNELIPRYFKPEWQTPANIWIYLIHTVAENDQTWLQRALASYEEVIAKARAVRGGA